MTTPPQHSDEWLTEALAQRDYEINHVPKHWEDTDEKKAADHKFRTVILAELEKREAAARREGYEAGVGAGIPTEKLKAVDTIAQLHKEQPHEG